MTMTLSKRDVLAALSALGALAASPALAQGLTGLSAGRAIGEAYLAAHPNTDLNHLRRVLLPSGFHPSAARDLGACVRDDFNASRVFIFDGWRLSITEAQLFALLT